MTLPSRKSDPPDEHISVSTPSAELCYFRVSGCELVDGSSSEEAQRFGELGG